MTIGNTESKEIVVNYGHLPTWALSRSSFLLRSNVGSLLPEMLRIVLTLLSSMFWETAADRKRWA